MAFIIFFSLFFCMYSVLIIMFQYYFLFWSNLFVVVCASWTFIDTSYLKLGIFSFVVLLKIFFWHLSKNSYSSLIFIICRFALFIMFQISWMFLSGFFFKILYFLIDLLRQQTHTYAYMYVHAYTYLQAKYTHKEKINVKQKPERGHTSRWGAIKQCPVRNKHYICAKHFSTLCFHSQ